MFGFQLSNIIPGFPKQTVYFVEPPHELLASQDCENGQVSSYSNKEGVTDPMATLTLQTHILSPKCRAHVQ